MYSMNGYFYCPDEDSLRKIRRDKIKGFNKNAFMTWLKEEFPGVVDTHWTYELVENVIDYATKYEHTSKNQFACFVSDMLPEVEFLEVARFCEDDYFLDSN